MSPLSLYIAIKFSLSPYSFGLCRPNNFVLTLFKQRIPSSPTHTFNSVEKELPSDVKIFFFKIFRKHCTTTMLVMSSMRMQMQKLWKAKSQKRLFKKLKASSWIGHWCLASLFIVFLRCLIQLIQRHASYSSLHSFFHFMWIVWDLLLYILISLAVFLETPESE